jgi:hypothetical protein
MEEYNGTGRNTGQDTERIQHDRYRTGMEQARIQWGIEQERIPKLTVHDRGTGQEKSRDDTEENKRERIQVMDRAGEDTKGNKTGRIQVRNRAGEDTEKRNKTGRIQRR